jgi:hypothetical protein
MNIVNKYIKLFFGKWQFPIVFYAFLMFFIAFIHLGKLNYVLFFFGVSVISVSFFYQLFKRKWLGSFVTACVIGATFAFLFFSFIASIFMEDGDHWADNLTIPVNIKIEKPIDLLGDNRRPDSPSIEPKKAMDFQLYDSFQPGLYEYDFWMNRIEAGQIYLKVYEITRNTPLSTNRLPESSRIEINNQSDNFKIFSTASHFTIYEGDWEKPYAARFEVWYKPDNGETEKKLFEKNYIIEGWMR